METSEAEFENVIKITDRFMASGDAEEVAFWLGYRHGIKHHLLGIDGGVPSEGHRCFIEVAEQGHVDKFIDAYAHGYQDGIDGKPPSVPNGRTKNEIANPADRLGRSPGRIRLIG